MSTNTDIANSALIKLGQEKLPSTYPDATTPRGIAISEQFPKVLKKLLRGHPWNFAMKRTKVSVANGDIDYSLVDTANETLELEGHGYITGQKVQISTSDTLPAPLAISTDYYIIKSSVDLFKLATSLSNALAGTAVNITTQGAGVHTVTPQDKNPEFQFDYQATLPSDYVRAFKVTSDQDGRNNIPHEIESGKLLSNYETCYMAYTSLEDDPSLFPDDFAECFALLLASECAYAIVQNKELKNSLYLEYKEYLGDTRFNDGFETTNESMQADYFIKSRY